MMDTKTAIALEESIAHWDELSHVEHKTDVLIGPTHCALCRLFWHPNCAGCPVSQKSGHIGCGGTPYNYAEKSADEWSNDPENDELRAKFRAAAIIERDFLISLRAPKRKFWVNIYENPGWYAVWQTRDDADSGAADYRIACIEVTEGDGL